MHVVPPLAHDGDGRAIDGARHDPAGDGRDEGSLSLTVDELAAAAGLPVRTVRHYQSEKVLPPPQRRGRIAVYGQEHLDRLLLIGRLQDRGLRLAAMRDVFKRVEKGEVWLDDWLGLGDELRAPWSEERPAVLTEAELTERVGGRPGAVAALVDAGLARRQHGLTSTYLVPSVGLLDITLQLDAAGVDIDTAAAAAGTIRKHLRRASGDLVDFFLERAGAGFARRGSTEDITEALGALRPLGARAVQLVFTQEIERALRHAVEQGRATPATPSPETAERAASDADREQTGTTS
jgi:DNA-binding transcriptional MerR regulator